ncbi:MAG: Type secretion system domain protein [Symbiobacteriaceae bacterium]|jgi:type IV pilus assembly protein PilC|nr:Type secretion system domain protein [Symbiobacteriaceae bacterium]
MKFRYRGRDSAGLPKTGVVEAADRGGALAALQQGGLVVTDLQAGTGIDLKMEIRFNLGARKVTAGDLGLFCDQLATLLGAGVPILQSLRVLAGQFQGKKLGLILPEIIASIESGDSLSQAMRQQREHLPATMIYITSVAEVSGRLDEAYALLARQFDEEEKLARKVRSAMTYPVAVLVIAVLVVGFMLAFVLPSYGNMYTEMGATMPTISRVLMGMGTFLRSQWYLLPPVAAGVWFGVRRLLRIEAVRERLGAFMGRLPLLGPLRAKRELSRFCRTLGTMNRSGVPLMAALLTAGDAMEDGAMKRAVSDIGQRLAEGDTFGEAMRAQPAFDRISVEMIALGEEAGTLETMLFKVAEVADKDVNLLLERLTALLEPLMTILVGGLVVMVIVPMILPMFDILGQVK